MLLDIFIDILPIADVPEHIIQTYLAGDSCLNHCDTIYQVFQRVYRRLEWDCEFTYLDPAFEFLHSFNDEPAVIYSHGTINYYKNGKLHRDGDEPAVIYSDGDMEYWKHDELHREEDKPARIYSDGSKEYCVFDTEYYIHGKLHRDGKEPALMWTDGIIEFYKHGQRYQ